MAKTVNFLGLIRAKNMKPTLKHRPAIWECMLGTVFAMNDEREIKYFDFKWKDALEFAGVKNKQDIRVFKNVVHAKGPRTKQIALWVEEGGINNG